MKLPHAPEKVERCVKTRRGTTLLDYLEQRIERDPNSGCWLWSGRIAWTGYGMAKHRDVGQSKTARVAHRVAYETLVGPVPDGLVLDHLCRTRSCVNPAHLEPVTHAENVYRGEGIAAINRKKTKCHRGHLLAGSNLSINVAGARVCRRCAADAQQRYRERRAAAGWDISGVSA